MLFSDPIHKHPPFTDSHPCCVFIHYPLCTVWATQSRESFCGKICFSLLGSHTETYSNNKIWEMVWRRVYKKQGKQNVLMLPGQHRCCAFLFGTHVTSAPLVPLRDTGQDTWHSANDRALPFHLVERWVLCSCQKLELWCAQKTWGSTSKIA